MIDGDLYNQINPSDFMQSLRDWEEKVLGLYKGNIRDEHFIEVTSKSINMGSILNKLPADMRRALMSEYMGLIKLPHIQRAYEASLKGAGSSISDASGGLIGQVLKKNDEGFSPIRLAIDPDDARYNPLAFILNQITPQLDIATGELKTGANVLRADYIEEMMSSMGKPISPGARMMVFDTETAGLLNTSGVHQLSWMSKDVGAAGAPNIKDLRFRTSQMQRGWIAGKGGVATKSMQDVIEDGLSATGRAFANAEPGSGADFVRSLRPFLDEMKQADYIVGHNVQFDLDQILQGLRRTGAYLDDTDGFRAILDEVTDATLNQGKIRDTLLMARTALPGLELSPEFKKLGKASVFSIENLMLNSNLFDLVRQDLGSDQAVMDMFGFGQGSGSLHSADVDTYVTSVLFDSLNQKTLKQAALGTDRLSEMMRSSVKRSYGLTPISKIANVEHIDRRVFAKLMEAEGGIEFADDAVDLTSLKAQAGPTSDEIYDYMIKHGVGAKFDVTPLEQEILLTQGNRKIADEMLGDWHSYFQFGKFRRFAGQEDVGGGFLNRGMTLFKRGIFPNIDQFEGLQDSLAKSGMPFANISLQERWFTHAVATAPTFSPKYDNLIKGLGDVESRLVSTTDDLGISRFRAYESPFIARGGRNINMAPRLIEMAEEAGAITSRLTDPDKLTMFDYSIFEKPDGDKIFNLAHKMDETDAANFVDWMRERIDLGDNAEFDEIFKNRSRVQDLLDNFQEIATTRGVGIARLEGAAGEAAYEAIDSFNIGTSTDAAKIPLRAGFMGFDSDSGVLRTGAWVLDRFGDDAFRQEYKENLDLAGERLEDLIDVGRRKPWVLSTMKNIDSTKTSGGVEKLLRGYDNVAKHAKKGLIGAAVLGAGYYLTKKHIDKQEFAPTMEQMPYENQQYAPLSPESAMQLANMTRGVDPLMTTGVVSNEYAMRSRHTQMGNNRHASLYNGAY